MGRKLQEQAVLVLDCQSTGANPEKGSLLEIGWTVHIPRAIGTSVIARLIALPIGERIPRRVSSLTGLKTADLTHAIQSDSAKEQLLRVASQVAGNGSIPTVIHFARFEEPFLRALLPEPFPLDLVCTHEIARRLLPDLPRRGLRAVAGYFGKAVPKLLRSKGHVEATCYVYQHLLGMLEPEGVKTWADLKQWLSESEVRPRKKRIYPMAAEKRLKLPDRPGVYRFLRRGRSGGVLYVGKARSLKKRVNSYFQKQRRIPERTLEMLSQAQDIQVTETDTALEAALLETDLIKELAPPYNVALTKENRSTWFCTTELDDVGEEPTVMRNIGPLPMADALRPLEIMRALVTESRTPTLSLAAAAVNVPKAWAPDCDCFSAGLELFFQRHGKQTKWRDLMQLGARLWQRDKEADALIEDEESKEHEWDPERVCASLEQVFLRASHLVRRARFLCRLSESTILFDDRILLFERGRVVQRDRATVCPVPKGVGRTRLERQRCLDLATTDRLRVLTTELKRLVREKRNVQLRLGHGPAVSGSALQRVIWWI